MTTPCKRCGSTERYRDRSCKPCRNDRSRRWAAEHPVRRRETEKRWNAANPEKRAETYKRYRATHRQQVQESSSRRRKANPERYREAARLRYAGNPEPRRLSARRYWEANHEECYKRNRRRLLKKLYGISPEEYDCRLAAQGGVCAVCQGASPNKKLLAVDHDHQTGAVRGLLCTRCNTALGQMQENPERCRALASYIEAFANAEVCHRGH